MGSGIEKERRWNERKETAKKIGRMKGRKGDKKMKGEDES